MVNATAINAVTPVSDGTARDLTRLREVTGKIVGSVFFGTLLKMMRDSALNGPYGHGGRGEAIFAEQLHGVLAERLGQAIRSGPGEALYKRLQPQQQRISERRDAG